MSGKQRGGDDGIPADDVDDVIGIAGELEEARRDRVPVEDLYAVADDLGVSREDVDRSRAELARRREAEAREAAAAKARRRRWWVRGGGAFASAFAVAFVWGLLSTAGLRDLYARVEAQRARVESVMQRREAVRQIFAAEPDSPDKVGELVGAENRVRVEAQRYAEEAAAYNAEAGRTRAWLGVVLRGLPRNVPVDVDPRGDR